MWICSCIIEYAATFIYYFLNVMLQITVMLLLQMHYSYFSVSLHWGLLWPA